MNISLVPDIVSGSRHFLPVTRNSCRSSVYDILLKFLPVIVTGRKRILSVTHENLLDRPMTGAYFMHCIWRHRRGGMIHRFGANFFKSALDNSNLYISNFQLNCLETNIRLVSSNFKCNELNQVNDSSNWWMGRSYFKRLKSHKMLNSLGIGPPSVREG